MEEKNRSVAGSEIPPFEGLKGCWGGPQADGGYAEGELNDF